MNPPVFFISYRRADPEGKRLAHMLHLALKNRYGEEASFLDVDKRTPGLPFPQKIQDAVTASKIMLAIIGPEWLKILRQRRKDAQDWVRHEITCGMARGEAYALVPVLLPGVPLPSEHQLPEALVALHLRDAVTIDPDGTFDEAFRGLVRDIERVVPILTMFDPPQDRPTWVKLREISTAGKELVSATLPCNLPVPRINLLQELDSVSQESATLAIIGPSGSGKSALAKLWVESSSPATTETIWLAVPDIARLEMSAKSFAELLSRARKPSGILVLDGAEHWSKDDVKWVALVAANTMSLAAWKLLITCQEQPWDEGVSVDLAAQGLPSVQVVSCEGFSDEELSALAESEPKVAALAAHEHLKSTLSLPQMLRVMLEAPQSGEANQWASEADVVAWWWRDRVCEGKSPAPSGTLARDLASALADQLTTELPESVADGKEEAAKILIGRGILARTRFGQLRFAHDLYADWSRVQSVQMQGESVLPFMREHIENPPWFRSLRVHCQQLLETPDRTERWMELIRPIVGELFKERAPYESAKVFAADLRILDAALEAILFCSQPGAALERVREPLLANRCYLLRRLLRCMTRSATQPDEVTIALSRMNGALRESDLATAARLCRIPRIRYWIPVIHFLSAHRPEALPFIAAEVAAAMPLFEPFVGNLRPDGFQLPDWWDQWCELTVECGERELRREIKDVWSWDNDFGESHDHSAAIYKSALVAADALPDRVAKLALKAVGRAEWEEGDLPEEYDEGWVGEYTPSFPSHSDDWTIVLPVEAWEHGPRREISSCFADTWLKGGAIALIRHRPEIACEITLACLIDWPKRNVREDNPTLAEKHGFRFTHPDAYPPFWHHGPFLLFLRSNWEQGLHLIVTLVNFATDRVAEWWSYKDDDHVPLMFDTPYGTTTWTGHPNVFGWHRDSLNTDDHVTCALMALEKWLMDSLVAEQNVDDAIGYLFREGQSIAFAGLLLTVGKAYPKLLLGPLHTLLFQWHCYLWDLHCQVAGLDGGGWFQDPPIVNRWRQEWWAQPHRKFQLKEVCCELILRYPEARELFGKVANKWRSDAATLPQEHPERVPLLRWASDFDVSTWREVVYPDGRKGWLFDRPKELCNPDEVARQNEQMDLMQIPYEAVRLLRARNPLTNSESTDWWQKLEQLARILDEQGISGNDSMRENPQHAFSAAMALLLCLAPDWIKADSAKLRILEERAFRLAASMKGRQSYSALDPTPDVEWFIARIAIRLWAMCPESGQWRAFSGSAISASRYETVRALFQEAFLARKSLGTGFDDLCRLVIAYSEQREEPEAFYVQNNAREERLRQWQEEWWPKFASGIVPEGGEHWGATLGASKSAAAASVARRLSYGFDAFLLTSAFDCVPADETAPGFTAAERKKWRRIDENLFAALLRTLPDNVPCEDRHRAPMPGQSEGSILQRTAARCVTAEKPEDARQFWEPLLEKGPNASWFAQHLLMYTKTAARKHGIDVRRLVPLFQGWLQFIQTSPKWTNIGRRLDNDLWKELLFLEPFSFIDGKDDLFFAPVMLALAPHYEAAVRDRQIHHLDSAALIHHLSGQAMRPLLPQVFEWCAENVSYGGIYWKDPSLRFAFAELIDTAWKHCLPAIRQLPEANATFKKIVLALAAEQDAVAIEVQAVLGREGAAK